MLSPLSGQYCDQRQWPACSHGNNIALLAGFVKAFAWHHLHATSQSSPKGKSPFRSRGERYGLTRYSCLQGSGTKADLDPGADAFLSDADLGQVFQVFVLHDRAQAQAA